MNHQLSRRSLLIGLAAASTAAAPVALAVAAPEAHNLQKLGGFFGDSYRLAVAVLDIVPPPSV